MNAIYHPVSTSNPEAQAAFDEGLTYTFAFNHDLAFKAFERASKLDPQLAMAYWGMALALGQNINQDITPENEKRAYEYSQKAISLMSYASPVEQAYIKALAQRYTNDPGRDLVSLRYAYRDAMKRVFAEYPQDLDLATLYVESILNLDPWKYWTWDGKPKEGTQEAISILQSVLNRNPYHIGANHYYVHAWEESPTPERALLAAFRLLNLLPASGHLLHMPCHIFILCGYYDKAIQTSLRAIAADRQYIKEFGLGGEYPFHYLPHNLKVLSRAYMLSEQYDNAMRAWYELDEFLSPYYQQRPHLTRYMVTPMEINLYFHRWDDLLALKEPPPNAPFVQAYWHFSRALSYLNLGDLPSYQRERSLMLEAKNRIPLNEEYANNPTGKVMDLAQLLLDASEACYQKNSMLYIANLKNAVHLQDRLNYDEPPAWFMPIRMELGQALLCEKQYKEAEVVFNRGLAELKRNCRLLYGLCVSLKEQGRFWDAFWVEREAESAVRNSIF
jgi:hypothetical protein